MCPTEGLSFRPAIRAQYWALGCKSTRVWASWPISGVPNCGRRSLPDIRPHICVYFQLFGVLLNGIFRVEKHPKARICWQWWNYLVASVPAERKIVRINLDETWVCTEPAPHRGVMFPRYVLKNGVRVLRRPTVRSNRRKGFTYLAMIADDPEIQACLPQILIGGPGVFNVRDQPAYEAAASHPKIIVLRRQKGWVNSYVFHLVIAAIAQELKPFHKTHECIFLIDAGKHHVTNLVSETFRLARFGGASCPRK